MEITINAYGLETLDGHPELHPDLTSLTVFHGGSLKDLCGISELGKLVSLDLSTCSQITSIAELSKLSELRSLKLVHCKSINDFTCLGEIRRLENLDLGHCELKSIAFAAGLPELVSLRLAGNPIDEGFEAFGNLTKMKGLVHCARSQSNLEALRPLKSLTALTVLDCEGLTDVEALKDLRALENVTFWGAKELISLDGIEGLSLLTELNFYGGNGKLESIDGLRDLGALRALSLYGCSSLLTLKGLEQAPALERLVVNGGRKLESIDALEGAKLIELELEECDALEDLDVLESMKSLESVNLFGCTSLKSLKPLGTLGGLRRLICNDSITDADVTEGSWLSGLTGLRELGLVNCTSITHVDALASMVGLTHVGLGGCESLQNVDGLSGLTQLEQLEVFDSEDMGIGELYGLENCESLVDIRGLANLTKIKRLSLMGCSSLADLRPISGMTDLEVLYLDGCSSLSKLDGLEKLTQLTNLDLLGCDSLSDISSIPEMKDGGQLRLPDSKVAIVDAEGLHSLAGLAQLRPDILKLVVKNGKDLTDISALSSLKSLSILSLVGCRSLTAVDALGSLTNLTELYLSGGWELRDIKGLGKLKKIRTLWLQYCNKVRSLQPLKAHASMRTLNIEGLPKVKNLDALSGMPELRSLYLRGCSSLENTEGINGLAALELKTTKAEEWALEGCRSLRDLDLLPHVEKRAEITSVDLWDWYSLENIDGITSLPKLEELKLPSGWRAAAIESLDCLAYLPSLSHLEIPRGSANARNGKRTSFATRAEVSAFQGRLRVMDAIATGGAIEDADRITALDLSDCEGLRSVDVLSSCTRLTSLDLSGCKDLESLDGLSSLQTLTTLVLGGCDLIQDAEVLTGLKSLTSLEVTDCQSLINVDDLAGLSSLERLSLAGCMSLESAGGLSTLTQLTALDLSRCESLAGLDVSRMASLTELDLAGCASLADLDGVEDLPALSVLDLSGCTTLPEDVLDRIDGGCTANEIKLPPRRLVCASCGGNSFAGHFGSRYSMTQWDVSSGERPLEGAPGAREKGAKSAWSTLVKELNADEEWRDWWDEVRTAIDVDAEARCVSCDESIELPTELFPSYNEIRDAPRDVRMKWSPALRVPSKSNSKSEGLDAIEDPGPGMPCPCCAAGRLKVFGEAVFLEHESGKQGGKIDFEGARSSDSARTWESRLEVQQGNGGDSTSTETIPAKMGFRAGVGCSEDGCWQARGLSRYADIPAAILAAAAFSAASCSLNDQEALDLAAVALDLEADDSGRSKLRKGALKWIGLASGSKDEELSSDSVRELQRVAKELLASITA